MSTATTDAATKVLLIEDSLGDARLMQEYLADAPGHPFELEHVETLETGLERLGRENFGLVLLDLSLPDCFGLETFTKTKSCAPEVPIIVLSGRDDEGLAMQTVHEGAQDYLVKGLVDSRLLVRAMRYAMERKRAEEALAKERDLLHTLLNNLPDRIYFKDQESRFLRISRAVADQFKVKSPREALGKTDLDFFLPEHAQAALADERRIMQTGEPILGKIERETLPDGSITWALTSKLPLRNRRGVIVGTFGISRDITPLKKAEEALGAERNLLRSLIDNLPDYIYVKDTQGRYEIDNAAHRRFLGCSHLDEIVGKMPADFFPPEVAAHFTRVDSEVVETGRPLTILEEPLWDRTQARRWHFTTKVPLRNAENQVIGLVCISRDITERKRFEERLQQANTELAQSKEQLQKTLDELRTSHEELKQAQIQLIQAEKMQAVGLLAAGIAHEVKNPLGILGMGIDYLTKNLVTNDENVSSILVDMNDALNRADAIIMGLLDFSTPRGLDIKAEHVGAILEETIGLIRHEMAAAPIRLIKELAPDLPPAWLDRNKIQQVFVNLLTNAIHAMPEGGRLTVKAYTRHLREGETDHDAGSRTPERFRAGDKVVVAEVIDTGTGIPEEKLAHIFDPFFTTKPTGKGTGLGLTVTKKIVELHGGTISIRNRKEGGVEVTVMFKA